MCCPPPSPAYSSSSILTCLPRRKNEYVSPVLCSSKHLPLCLCPTKVKLIKYSLLFFWHQHPEDPLKLRPFPNLGDTAPFFFLFLSSNRVQYLISPSNPYLLQPLATSFPPTSPHLTRPIIPLLRPHTLFHPSSSFPLSLPLPYPSTPPPLYPTPPVHHASRPSLTMTSFYIVSSTTPSPNLPPPLPTPFLASIRNMLYPPLIPFLFQSSLKALADLSLFLDNLPPLWKFERRTLPGSFY